VLKHVWLAFSNLLSRIRHCKVILAVVLWLNDTCYSKNVWRRSYGTLDIFKIWINLRVFKRKQQRKNTTRR